MKSIVVRWVKCNEGICPAEMRVSISNHPHFEPGSRFDFGFFQIATREGYIIVSIPIDEEEKK